MPVRLLPYAAPLELKLDVVHDSINMPRLMALAPGARLSFSTEPLEVYVARAGSSASARLSS